MALAIDGTPQKGGSGPSASTVAAAALTTSIANDVIIACIHTERNGVPPTVASISGGGLTWIQRSQVQWANSNNSTQSNLEVWYAIASGTLSAQTITATLSASNGDGAAIVVFAVSGANTTTPWDVHAGLPAHTTNNTGSGSAPSVTISTTNTDTMVLGFWGWGGPSGSQATVSAPWTSVNNELEGAGANFSSVIVERQIFSSAQTSLAVTMGATPIDYAIIGDAIQAASTEDDIPASTAALGLTMSAALGSNVEMTASPGLGVSLTASLTKIQTSRQPVLIINT